MTKIIDLSHLIEPLMTVFPGSERPKIEKARSFGKDGFVEHRVKMFTHTGTHVDVPGHILAGGLTLDKIDVSRFVGKAVVLDFSEFKTEFITRDTLKPYKRLISKIEFLIIRTGWDKYWGKQQYFKGFPVLDAEAAQWLCGFKLKGVGVDTISVDPVESKTIPIHRVLFKKNIIIIENLTNLGELEKEVFTFTCLPLKLKNGDGSPVRAVGIL
jgi:kynurenine formamidase